jgi:hypothetical protein
VLVDTMRVCSAAIVGGSRGSGGLSCSYIRKIPPHRSRISMVSFSGRAVLGTRLVSGSSTFKQFYPFVERQYVI